MKLLLCALLFVAGTLSLSLFQELPGWHWFFFVACLLPLPLTFRSAFPLLFLLLGHLLAGIDAHGYYNKKLPLQLHGTDFDLDVVIDSFPKGDSQRVTFFVQSDAPDASGWEGGRIRLSWRNPDSIPRPGDTWKFRVRLFTPSGSLNQNSFDYERWLFSENIVATGYVRDIATQMQTDRVSLDTYRQRLKESVDSVANDQHAASAALLKALLIGDRSAIDEQQRQAFQVTGTSHLIAISGLHIGLIATASWMMTAFLWSRSTFLMRITPAPVAGAVAAIFAAAVYAALAGFSLPTQRALIMTLVFAGSTCLRLYYTPLDRFSVALILVTVLDPRALLQPAFWFSFTAVLLLILLYQYRRHLSTWQLVIIAQLLLTMIMLPLQAQFGMSLSLISPLVNWVAVPWFSLFLVPATLISALSLLVGLEFPLQLALQLSESTLLAINAVAKQTAPLVALQTSVGMTLLSVAAVLLLVSASSTRRLLLFSLLYAISWFRFPASGDYLKLVVFDVGQGQSMLLETQNHRLVYDLGPAYPGGFNTAESVVIPYLRSHGIEKLDTLILSHDDSDHVGAAETFLSQLPVDHLLAGQAVENTGHFQPAACKAGDSWIWDGVQFEILHPGQRVTGASDNDMSCLLLVTTATGSLLLTGDITRKVETSLLATRTIDKVGLVTVPHHGSHSSSSDAFVATLSADYGVISSGWRNRYGHPHSEVMERWLAHGTQIFNTADTGMLIFTWKKGDATPEIESWRDNHASFWNR